LTKQVDNITKGLLSARNQKIFMASSVVLILMLSAFLPRLEVDFELEKLFPKGDPDVDYYQQLVQEMGYDNDFLLILLEPRHSFFDSTFLHQAKKLSDSIANLAATNMVQSPLALPYFVNGPLGLSSYPLIDIDRPQGYTKDSLKIVRSDFHSRYFDSFQYLPIYVQHRHFSPDENTSEYVSEIEQLVADTGIQYTISGKLPAENAFKNQIRIDFLSYLGSSLIICFIALVLIFRNLRQSLLPFLIGILTLVATFGVMAISGISVNIMSVLLPPLLLFTSTSDCVHLINAYRNASPAMALSRVLKPTFLTSFTTAVGLLSLLFIPVEPIQHFGVSTTIGVLFAFIFTYAFLPYFLRKTVYPAPDNHVDQSPVNYLIFLGKNRVTIGVVTGSLIAVSLFGLGKLEIDAYLLSDLPKDLGITNSFERMDSTLGGSKPWTVTIEADNNIWSKMDNDVFDSLHSFIEKEYGVEQLTSPYYAWRYASRIYPKNEQKRVQLAKQVSRNYSDTLIVLQGLIPEWGSAKTRSKDQDLRRVAASLFPVDLSLRITGTTFLIDKSHHKLSENLAFGLLTAIMVVSFTLGLSFASLRWTIISLIPNLLTLLILGGIIGWMGISLQLSNAIVFSVAFGIVVDDTIHFIVTYREGQQKERSPLLFALRHAGRSIVYTSVVIILGFSLFLLSSFGATFYLGLFLVLAVAIALIIDLLFIPLFLTGKQTKSHIES
jgi:predicted RND superfamily exporter protein